MIRSEFRWSEADVVWLLGHLYSMREGRSPFDREDIIKVGKRTASSQAPFIPMAELAADIDLRIKRCEGDGVLLMWHYCEGKSFKEISIGAHRDQEYVERHIARALRYICGEKPKTTEYKRTSL
jgi:hypothetical protein